MKDEQDYYRVFTKARGRHPIHTVLSVPGDIHRFAMHSTLVREASYYSR